MTVADLPPRQSEVLALVARGAANKEIATALGISSHTVITHVTRLMQSLGVQSRAALACLYYGGEPYVPTMRVHGDRYAHRR